MQSTLSTPDGIVTEGHKNHKGPKGDAVSWGAVVGGAFVAAAVTAILALFGSGIGLASVSPWHNEGASAKAIGIGAVIWLIVVQWISSGFGGYLAGRLRIKRHCVHEHEEFFRDTAHGLLTWAIATVIVLGVLSSALVSIAGNGLQAGALIAGASATGAASSTGDKDSTDFNGYLIDTLFRTDHVDAAVTDQEVRNQTLRILAVDLKNDAVPDGDKAYLAQLVALRTGIAPSDAQKRVDDLLAQAHDAKVKTLQTADEARKAAAKLTIVAFLSMIIGAFVASAAAALGGHDRDHCFPKTEVDCSEDKRR